MRSDFNFTFTSWFLGNVLVRPYFNSQCMGPNHFGRVQSFWTGPICFGWVQIILDPNYEISHKSLIWTLPKWFGPDKKKIVPVQNNLECSKLICEKLRKTFGNSSASNLQKNWYRSPCPPGPLTLYSLEQILQRFGDFKYQELSLILGFLFCLMNVIFWDNHKTKQKTCFNGI